MSNSRCSWSNDEFLKSGNGLLTRPEWKWINQLRRRVGGDGTKTLEKHNAKEIMFEQDRGGWDTVLGNDVPACFVSTCRHEHEPAHKCQQYEK